MWLISLSQTYTQIRKIIGPWPNLIRSEGGQDTSCLMSGHPFHALYRKCSETPNYFPFSQILAKNGKLTDWSWTKSSSEGGQVILACIPNCRWPVDSPKQAQWCEKRYHVMTSSWETLGMDIPALNAAATTAAARPFWPFSPLIPFIPFIPLVPAGPVR